jgi:hypothetical protein
MSDMKILHVWDHCGVSFLITKHMVQHGHQAIVLKQGDSSNRLSLGQDKFYSSFLLGENSVPPNYSFGPKIVTVLRAKLWKLRNVVKFYVTAARLSRFYDIVHVNSLYWLFFLISKRKLILHFHGTDIRDSPSVKSSWDRLVTRLFIRLFSPRYTFYLSTPDMTKDCPNGVFVPNPVDTNHFKMGSRTSKPKTALYIQNWHEGSSDWAKAMAKKYGLQLTILDRTQDEYIPYSEFPEYLGKFEFFIDRHVIKSLSKTALEALAVGLKVIRWDGKIVEGLPSEHLPENVARKWLEIYSNKLK